jgi:DNA-directed RNA polymerase subunit RPC12/RpoP
MKWKNLKYNRCPKCERNLSTLESDENIRCNHCGFFISYKRFREICTDLELQSLEKRADNFLRDNETELNNL